MRIKFLDLTQNYYNLKSQIDPLISEILETSNFIGGKFLQEFEENFACFTQTRGCVGVGNGTDALEIAIKALCLPKNSEIILPANSFIASCEAILNNDLKAVFVDCNENYLIDTDKILEAITPQTSAIMPVHLYGRTCDMYPILQIAHKHDLKIIEDCSQAHGAKTQSNKSIGSIGDIGCFSFYPGKNLGAYGDGGAIVSNDITLLQNCRSISNHGTKNSEKYLHIQIGRNSRLDALQAAILNIKLKFLPAHNIHRQKNACLYEEKLHGLKNILTPTTSIRMENVWHLFVVRLIGEWEGKRDEMKKYLAKNGVDTSIHYPQALNEIQAIASHPNCIVSSSANAKSFAKNILSLPIGEHIGEKEITYICEVISKFQA